eukprot:CAMPEP_0172808932 /NCGR_PEP_ID=MMETSP1075-20121228/7963_1 /TAXON_ID=2916 /ORGANISM="Ceratium fusus, Strain PA161109" /LENGTH=465 /DNA_ID=CAMNT_0013648125 /DNA_START=19 /DNA_END=1416 /DNA_ORIENTATION=-
MPPKRLAPTASTLPQAGTMPPQSGGTISKTPAPAAGQGRRRMLMLKMFPRKFSSQEKVERCMDAFIEMHDGEWQSLGSEEMILKVYEFITEADQILGDHFSREEKRGLSVALGQHPWFVNNGYEVRYLKLKNSLSLEVIEEAEPAPRSRSPPRRYSWTEQSGPSERSLAGMSWETVATKAVKLGTTAKARPSTKALPPPTRDPKFLEAENLGNALVQCLPTEARPQVAEDDPFSIITDCYNSRGDDWPRLDTVGGGTGGDAGVPDLHALSETLLARVKEKYAAVPVMEDDDENSDLTASFVTENQLGTESDVALRRLPLPVNLRVISAGAVVGFNRDAVLGARIRRAREAFSTEKVEISQFIEDNWVSTDTERAMRVASPEVHQKVIAEGPVLGQHPSAELASRLEKARNDENQQPEVQQDPMLQYMAEPVQQTWAGHLAQQQVVSQQIPEQSWPGYPDYIQAWT